MRGHMKVEFRPVTEENREDVLTLRVAENQKGFIESVEQCLKEAGEWDCWRPVGIYVDGCLVGFSMYCLWASEKRVWMDRLLIDERYQGRGYGTRCFPLLLERIKKEYSCSKIYLSIVEENERAAAFYQKFGFRFNGESDVHGEKVMELSCI